MSAPPLCGVPQAGEVTAMIVGRAGDAGSCGRQEKMESRQNGKEDLGRLPAGRSTNRRPAPLTFCSRVLPVPPKLREGGWARPPEVTDLGYNLPLPGRRPRLGKRRAERFFFVEKSAGRLTQARTGGILHKALRDNRLGAKKLFLPNKAIETLETVQVVDGTVRRSRRCFSGKHARPGAEIARSGAIVSTRSVQRAGRLSARAAMSFR